MSSNKGKGSKSPAKGNKNGDSNGSASPKKENSTASTAPLSPAKNVTKNASAESSIKSPNKKESSSASESTSAKVAHKSLCSLETRLFIDNEFVNAKSGKTFETVNPATEEVIADVQEAGEEDVNLAVEAAQRAFADNAPWRTMPSSQRRDLMLKLASLIERDRVELAKLETADNGKAIGQKGKYGSSVDLHLVIQCFKYYAGHADKICGTTIPVDSKQLVYTIREPIGVCGAIIPWNFPLLMLAWKLGPALASGCTIVVKTSEKTPLSALAIAKLIVEAGFPKGVINIINGYGKTGEILARHMSVRKIAFTGSTLVGHKIMQYAAESNLKRVTLELGGKSPLIVCEDADIEQALDTVHAGIFMNHGQCCCASSRVYVQSKIYDKFVQVAAERAKARVVGDPEHEDTHDGPLVDKIQFERVLGYISKGKEEGATALVGGERDGKVGYFVKPTIFSNVTDDMTIAKEEIFGPVLCCLKFDKLEEAVERCNNSKYGLAAGICTRDVGAALSIASKLRAGTVWVNTWNSFDAAQPFGGYKESGIGRELGAAGLDNYLETKTVVIPIDR